MTGNRTKNLNQALHIAPIAMFEAQVRLSGDARAIQCDGGDYTYRTLDLAAEAVARGIASKGVGQGSRVALFMPRGADFIVGVLAAMKLGATYVPLDPATPARRLQRLLARCRPALVVTSENIGLPQIDYAALTIGELHSDGQTAGAPLPSADDRVTPDAVAYILHTSGTTGEPNGVQVTQRGLANYLAWAAGAYCADGTCSAFWHTATTFDLSITSFLLPLTTGGCVDVLPTSSPLEGLLRRLLDNRAPILVKMTPTHGRAIVSWFDGQGQVNPAELVFVIGGEELLVQDARALKRVFPNCRIYNEYGPTEATVGCCAHRWDDEARPDAAGVPIGVPISNMRMFIVDAEHRIVPEGQRGEIVIAGPGVMGGYLDEDDLNARKLVRFPWHDGPCYMTGDYGSVDADGTFQYHGRVDTQIKLNGYRIELAEIEAAALEAKEVRNAAATVQRINDTSVLTLFVDTSAAEPHAVEEALDRELARVLPEYMRPARIVAQRFLPVTSHGKIDRQALSETVPAEARQAPPTNSVEETLVAVWQLTLQCEPIGIDDNYFALGGDSLRSIEITAMAEERGIRLSIPMLHQNPTIRSLAKAIEGGGSVIEVAGTQPFFLVPEEDRRNMPADVEDAYPLNLLQEGMIYHREFAAKSAVYHAICSYHVAMPVDVEALRTAVRDLVARHPLLRTSFDLTRYSRPLQLVHRASEPEFGYLDLRETDSTLHQDFVDSWLEDEKKRGFEIEQYPLIRFMLHHFSDDSCQLSYSFHHEIIDGWSDALMVTELMNRYMSIIRNVPFDPGPLQSTFRDSILLEQQAVGDDSHREFWNEKMRDVSVMRLPSFVPPKADRGQREIIKFEVPIAKELSDGLKHLARDLAVPLKSVLLAAHMKVMSLLGGVEDVLTYTVSNGRPENRDSHAVIGLFVNSLAFRMNLSGGSWADLIMATLQTENELLARRRYPMAELKRQHGSEPLSETLFFFNHYHVTDALKKWQEVTLLGLKVYAESTFPYCVNAYLTPFDNHLCVRIEYDRLRYAKEVMDVAGHFYHAVLSAMVRDRHADYHGESFLPQADLRRLVLPTAGQLGRGQPGAIPIPLAVTQIGKENPEQPAIVSPGLRLTYAQLDEQANRLADYLITHERVLPGDHVGVLMERGAESLVATLAVLKAGAAYVPLSVDLPASRLFGALKLIGGTAICSDASHAALAEHAGSGVKLIRYGAAMSGAAPGRSVNVQVPPESPAYIIFTSGSAGMPKAVMVSRGNLEASTRARTQYYGLATQDRCVLLPSPAFDSAVGVIFGALASGATLLVPDDETMLDLPALLAFMKREGATMTLCTPSLLETLLDAGGLQTVGLKHIISAGEALSPETYSRAAAIDGATVFNEYGPTEATVWASVWRAGECRPMPSMPIGQANSAARLYVLDRHLHPVAAGVPGELYIGGEGVALGYLGDPAQTAASYLPDPFSGIDGARMYRTGDLVRVDLDGHLEFLSRRDRMIKVQGFRVELGEVEHTLAMHDSVHRAVATVKEVNGAKQLIAYVVRSAAHTPADAEQLKAFCRQLLPKYMVPSHFVFVEAVPLSGTGKVDFTSLDRLAPRAAGAREGHVAPRSTTEAMLLDIWRNVLHVDHIGVYDDFTELGGESLAALRIAAKVRSTFGTAVSVRELIAAMNTVSELAAELDSHPRRGAGGDVSLREDLEVGEL